MRPLFGKVPRWLKVALACVVGVFLVYLIAINAMLRFGAVEAMVNGSKDARLSLGGGYSVWPGRIHVRDLKLRFHDRNIEFLLVMPDTDVTLDMTDLMRRRLHATSVKGEGIRFIMRHKVETVKGNERRLEAFPKIAGFADPPLLKHEPKVPMSGKEWSIQLENVDVQVSELWFMEYRMLGDAVAQGAFELVPGHRLAIDGARLDIRKGTLYTGPKRMLGEKLGGHIVVNFAPANPDIFLGLSIFRQISTQIQLNCILKDLRVAELYLSPQSKLHVAGGRGKFDARVFVESGYFKSGTLVRYESDEDIRIMHPEFVTSAGLSVQGNVTPKPGETTRLKARFAARDIALQREKTEHPPVTARAASADLAFASADIAAPWSIEEAALDLPQARIEDLGFIGDLLSSEGKRNIEAGTAALKANAKLSEGKQWNGAVRADFRSAAFQFAKRRVRLDGDVSAAFETEDRAAKTGRVLDARVKLERVKLEGPGGKSENFWITASSPRIDYRGFPPHSIASNIKVEAANATPILTAFELPDLLREIAPKMSLEADARLEIERDRLDLDVKRAEVGPADIKGRLRNEKGTPKGAFLIGGAPLSVGVDVHSGGVSVVLMAGENWLEQRLRELNRWSSRFKPQSRHSPGTERRVSSPPRARTN